MLKHFYLLLFIFFSCTSAHVLVEIDGAGFFPTGRLFRQIYHSAAPWYGAEVTVQWCEENENVYAFGSIDCVTKEGHSIGFCSPTKVTMVPFALGLKYLIPFCGGDFYVGLGIEPVYLKTTNCSSYVAFRTSHWGCGGIAKVGMYLNFSTLSDDLSDYECCDNLFLNVFFNYSFAKIGCKSECVNNFLMPLKANLSGLIAGAGIGYRF